MVLIIGGTGYIGRYLSIYLKEKGYDVLALGRSDEVKGFFDENNIKFQKFNLEKDEDYEKLPTNNVEAIINLAALLAEHETPVERFFDVNTIGVYKILEFARKNNIKKVIMTSSHKVYNDVNQIAPISEEVKESFKGDHTPYIISKIAAENFMEYYHKDFGLDTITLRLTGVHGYGEILGFLAKDGTYTKSTFEIFVEKALKGEDIEVWGNNEIKRDHVYIKDVLSAIECSITAENASGIYNIASGKGYSLYEEAKVIAKVFAKDNKESKVTLDESKPGLSRGYIYDISKAKKGLNWTPKYDDYEVMLRDYKKEWEDKKFKNYHKVKKGQEPVTF
jgi:UDP-glucose 4-epimerase